MAQVPYSPVPDVAPQDNATPYLHVDAPPDAFGANIARAGQQLGQTADTVGNELFTRANAMQQLDNENEVIQAGTDYQQKVGQVRADFVSQQGNNAGPAALATFQQRIADLRDDTRSDLSNPAAQKLFDQSSMRIMAQANNEAAGHSGQQLKVASIQASTSRAQGAMDTIMSAPGDETAFQNNLQTGVANTIRTGQVQGKDQSSIDQDVVNFKSNAVLTRIQGYVAGGRPEIAQGLLTQALADGSIRGPAIGQVTSLVEKGLYNTGAKNVANGIATGASMALGQSPVSIERAADAIGGFETGNTYSKLGPVITQGQYQGQQALGKYQIMPGNLPGWLQQTGLPAMTPQEFVANPGAQDKVFQSVFGGLMQKYGNFNDAASAWLTGKPVAQAGGATDQLGTGVPAYLAGTNALLAKSAGLSDKVAAARQQANSIAPNLPLMADYAEQHVISQDRQDKAVAQNDFLNNKNAFDSALTGQNGPIPSSPDQLTGDAQAAYQKMTPAQQIQANAAMRTAASNDNTPSPERSAQAQQLKGLYGTDPATFAQTDMMHQNLTVNDRRVLVGLQSKMLKGGSEDPRVSQGMQIMSPSLQAAGITMHENPDLFNQYRGNLADEISDFQKEKNRAPSRDEVKNIGAQLLQNQSSPGRLWGTNQTPMFQMTPPDADRQKIMDAFGAQGVTPTDQQIQAAYTRSQFKTLYGKPPAQSSVPSAAPPRG